MEEQGGETRESKYRRLHYDGGNSSSSEIREPPEGFGFMNQMIETDRSEKLEPIMIGGFPILQPDSDSEFITVSKATSNLPLELMRYLYPDFDPSDPCGPKSRCREVPTPVVYSDEAHKQVLLDWQATAIQRQAALEADLKVIREKAFEEFRRHCAAKSSGTKADQNLGESSSTIA